eukprot:1926340-Rhodomonas_salina.1
MGSPSSSPFPFLRAIILHRRHVHVSALWLRPSLSLGLPQTLRSALESDTEHSSSARVKPQQKQRSQREERRTKGCREREEDGWDIPNESI